MQQRDSGRERDDRRTGGRAQRKTRTTALVVCAALGTASGVGALGAAALAAERDAGGTGAPAAAAAPPVAASPQASRRPLGTPRSPLPASPAASPTGGAHLSVDTGDVRLEEDAGSPDGCPGPSLTVHTAQGTTVHLSAGHRHCTPEPPRPSPTRPTPAPPRPPGSPRVPSSPAPTPPAPERPAPEAPVPPKAAEAAAPARHTLRAEPPEPAPTRDEPSPKPPQPSPSHSLVAAPHRALPDRQQPTGDMSMVTRTLLIIAPAVLAAAALRPRSSGSPRAASAASGEAAGGGGDA